MFSSNQIITNNKGNAIIWPPDNIDVLLLGDNNDVNLG